VVSIIASKIKGIVIEIGGNTQPLNKALADVNKKSKDLQSELRQVEKLLKLNPKDTEMLAQKQKLLAEAVQNSKEKLDRLKTVQQQVNEQFQKGEIAEEQYRAFQREVAKAEQDLSKFERQLAATAKTTETWKDKLDKAQTSLKNVGAKMTNVGKTLSMSVTAPIAAVGAASFKMAADLQDAMGATDQTFKSAAESMKKWADSLESYYGIAEGEALEYANMMGSMLQNIGGLTEEEAAKQAQTLIKLAGDLTAMYGGTTADAVRALTGALKGNNTMLDNYGMAANDAMVKTKALEMGLYDGTGQMDLATKQAATLALIMEQSAAAQGQAAREAEGASGGMRAFATEIKNLSTDIGEVLLPVITPLLANLNDIVKKFGDLSPEMKKAIVIVAGLAAAIGPLLILLGALSMAIGAISLPVVAVIAGIAALGAAIVGIYKLWKENGEKSKKLIAEFTAAIQRTLDNLKNWLSNTWNSIKQTASNVWNGIKSAILNPIESAKQTILDIITTIKNAFANMKIQIPKFKLPHVSVGVKYKSIGDLDIPYPSFSVDWYAKGGIFARPSVIGVGEAGTEAVIPLEKMPGLIADALRDAMGGGQVAMAGGITVQNMYVRNDQDIKLVARELYNLQQTNARGRGLR
jgi:phage-related minor tail protein